jgi:hypothetical protein
MNDTDQPAPAQPDVTGEQAYAATLARLIADPHATEVYISYLNQRMEASRRQKNIQNLTLLLPAVIGILGLIGVFVSDYVIDKASERVRESVQNEQIEGALAELNNELLLQRLAVNATTLDLKDKIDDTSLADESLEQLRLIAAVPALRDRGDFRYILERVTLAYVAFSLTEHVYEVAALFANELAANPRTAGAVSSYLAEDMLSDAMPFEHWPQAGVDTTLMLFEASHRLDITNEVLAFESLVEFARGEATATDVTASMIQLIEDLETGDQAYVLEDYISLADAELRHDMVDAGTERLAELNRQFIAAHRDQLNAILKSVAVQEQLLVFAERFQNTNPARSRAIRDTVKNGF